MMKFLSLKKLNKMITPEQALNLKSNQTIYKISSDKQFNRIIEPVQVISISQKMVTLFCNGKYRTYLDTLDCYFLTEDEAK